MFDRKSKVAWTTALYPQPSSGTLSASDSMCKGKPYPNLSDMFINHQAGEAIRTYSQQRTSLGAGAERSKTRRRLCQKPQLWFIVTYTTYVLASMQCHRSKSNLPTWREQVVRSPICVRHTGMTPRGAVLQPAGPEKRPHGSTGPFLGRLLSTYCAVCM